MRAGMKNGVLLAFAAVALTGCIGEAQIASPVTASAAVERLELRGMGGWTRGDFVIGSSHGTFVRSAARGSLFGLVDKVGGGRFTLGGPLVAGTLSGGCDFNEEEVKLGRGVSLTTRPLLYRCGFDRDGRRIDADLVLEAAHDSPGAMIGYQRKGMLFYEGQRIGVRSIHRSEGGKVPTATPLGYAFNVGGREIGAIDLNGLNKTLFVPRDPRLREAVLAASLALSIFWDPADSD